MQTGDIKLIKNINVRLVLNLIRKHESISAAELAKITGMRPSTISNIVKELLEKELIVKQGKGESTEKGGKRPILLGLNTEGKYFIGLDIEIGMITVVLLDLTGQIEYKSKRKVDFKDDLGILVQEIIDSVNCVIDKQNLEKEEILGIGIAIAGIVNINDGYVSQSDILSETNFSLLEKIEKQFDIPVMLDNNANASAIGAKWVGAAKECNNFITILIEIEQNVGGLGIGLILNGELYKGATFGAGELNIKLPTLHDTIFTQEVLLEKGIELKKYKQNLKDIDIDIMVKAVKMGDEVAKKYFRILGNRLGKMLAYPISMVNPEKLVIAGEVAEAGDALIKPIEEQFSLEMLPIIEENLEIVTNQYGKYSVAIGAASLIIDEFFKVPVVKSSKVKV
ncbi:MAG: ROK family transcriptional regulator [Candidatus Marinimicrobia bacterium]|nr:ROK family transcriptional regulator [Candidatus Neomarinimicrobiota bacterium]